MEEVNAAPLKVDELDVDVVVVVVVTNVGPEEAAAAASVVVVERANVSGVP